MNASQPAVERSSAVNVGAESTAFAAKQLGSEIGERPQNSVAGNSSELTTVAENLTLPVALGSVAAALIPEFALAAGLAAALVGFLLKTALDHYVAK